MTYHPHSHELLAVGNTSPRMIYPAKSRFVVVDGWLELDGQQVLCAPRAVLEHFAEYLNLLDPPRRVLPAVVRALIEQTRGSHFTIGEALRRMGAV